jgi:ABC transport system ATP-binding/permease protein
MQYLKVTNLTKSYTSQALVDHVDFTISKDQKIALVAKNGAWKSTLLKLLVKEIDLTDWEIQWKKDIDIGYLVQECSFDTTKTVREILFDFDLTQQREEEIQLQIIIDKLKITPYLDQQIKTLSWGESKRVMLAKVLAHNPPMLILDEPTNHLDLDMIEWLERYLKKQHITLLMVTHDRYFLERICTDIFELERWKIYQYPGNYSYFLEKKAEREENEKIEVHKLKQLFKKELDRIRKSPQWRQTKANFREKRFYGIEENYDSLKEIRQQESKHLKLDTIQRHLGTKILKLKNIQKSFGKKSIIQNFSHEFKHGERIWIIGKNWVGKSTFIKMLLWEEIIDSGLIQAWESVVFGHYQQKEIQFPDDKRLIDIVPSSKLLEQFLFSPNQQHQFAKTLSGGEKRRLYLLTILQKNPNFLILDEPTNDLDLVTLWVLEDFLLNYKWCLIIVSHDRFFMDRLVDHLFIFEGQGKIQDFRWTYTQYKQNQENKLQKQKEIKTKSDTQKLSIQSWLQQSSDTKKKLSYMEKRELQQLGEDIQKLEKRKEEINLIFNESNIPFDEIKKLSTELWEILRRLEIKESRRFELIERE